MSDQTKDNKQMSFEERLAMGKSLRKQVPLGSHDNWTPAPDRPDPLDLLLSWFSLVRVIIK
jgi:hypothetical protein